MESVTGKGPILAEQIYDNNGRLKKGHLLDPRQHTVDNVRKLLTHIEFELMNEEPNKKELRRMADSARTLLQLEFCGKD